MSLGQQQQREENYRPTSREPGAQHSSPSFPPPSPPSVPFPLSPWPTRILLRGRLGCCRAPTRRKNLRRVLISRVLRGMPAESRLIQRRGPSTTVRMEYNIISTHNE